MKKSTKVNSRENLPNIETNLPQVAKMRKGAPKPKFNRFKVLETECFYGNNLRGTLENARETQIWRGKRCRRQENEEASAAFYKPQALVEKACKKERKRPKCPREKGMAGRLLFLAGQPSAFCRNGRPAIYFCGNRLDTSPWEDTRPAMLPTCSPSSLQILRKIGVPGT